jgi:hypothetical protein
LGTEASILALLMALAADSPFYPIQYGKELFGNAQRATKHLPRIDKVNSGALSKRRTGRDRLGSSVTAKSAWQIVKEVKERHAGDKPRAVGLRYHAC